MNASSFDLNQEDKVQTVQEKVESENDLTVISHEEVINHNEELETEEENVIPTRKEFIKKKPLAQSNILGKSNLNVNFIVKIYPEKVFRLLIITVYC